MPYINQAERPAIDTAINAAITSINNEGQLNYAITRLIHLYTKKQTLRYKTINEVMGVLSCVTAEYYARVARPYEDQKIKSNGDVGIL
jgi:hypothetical protein